MRPVPTVVLDILHILTHIARHSSEACSQVNLPLYEFGNDRDTLGIGKKDQVKLRQGDQTNLSVLRVFCLFAWLHIFSYLCSLLFLCSCLTVLDWLRPLSENFSLLSGIPKWLNQGFYLPVSMELLVPVLWSSSGCWHLEAEMQQPGWWVVLGRAFLVERPLFSMPYFLNKQSLLEVTVSWSWRNQGDEGALMCFEGIVDSIIIKMLLLHNGSWAVSSFTLLFYGLCGALVKVTEASRVILTRSRCLERALMCDALYTPMFQG